VLVSHAPDDFDRQLVALRMRLRITQTQLAARIGAAGNAVIYQWESRKRRPSSILWRRVIELAESGIQW
jgi:DNA-binding transcriptional regulator YiaG